MGLAGGSHCLAMCSAPCGALLGGGGAASAQTLHRAEHGGGVHPAARGGLALRHLAFHGGRIAGYAAAGALAALAMDSLAWLSRQSPALRPAWTLLHVAVMAWGLLLLLRARQPAWVEQAGRSVWLRLRPWVQAPGGVLAAGLLWALLPCGLLYSALLLAALSGGALAGALNMAAFGVGSGLWLLAGPWLWRRIQGQLDAARAEWGSRAAGALLCAVAAWAIWLDLNHQSALWCR